MPLKPPSLAPREHLSRRLTSLVSGRSQHRVSISDQQYRPVHASIALHCPRGFGTAKFRRIPSLCGRTGDGWVPLSARSVGISAPPPSGSLRVHIPRSTLAHSRGHDVAGEGVSSHLVDLLDRYPDGPCLSEHSGPTRVGEVRYGRVVINVAAASDQCSLECN